MKCSFIIIIIPKNFREFSPFNRITSVIRKRNEALMKLKVRDENSILTVFDTCERREQEIADSISARDSLFSS
jgi:hypothetical protein